MCICIYIYIKKMLNKHYQKKNKEAREGTKIFLKKKKNIVNIIAIEINIFLKEKSKELLNI